MKRILFAFFGLALAGSSQIQAQVNYSGGVYGQSFDALPGTTNNTLNLAWTDNTTLPGWYANKTTFSVTNGTIGGTAATFSPTAAANPNNVGLFSFGTASSTDRALGSRATAAVAGNNPVLYGVRLVNTTAQTLTSFTVTFTGEQWFKSGKTTPTDTLLVDYQIGATSLTAGTWNNASGGTFSSLINTATAATLDGNAAANRRGIAVKVTGVSWAPGAELWVRIRDDDQTSDEQGLAVDDFYFFAENESAVFFNGSTSYVTMGFGATAASLNASNFTVECRFMRTGPGVIASTGTGGVTNALPLVAKGVGEADGTPVDADYFLGIDNSTSRLVADFEQRFATVDPNGSIPRAAGQNFPVFGSTVLQNGVFYHVAATYDTATAVWKLYVNGVPETTTQTLPTFVGVVPNDINTQGLGVGTTINSTGARAGFFHGLIDEVRIWNVARSESEILANKDVEITSATGLLGRYAFDEAAGTTAAGTNAAGGAAPIGTLAGAQLPVWVNAKSFAANLLPSVTLTAPADGTTVLSGATVTLTADASDTDGTITKVEFYQGATKLGEDTTAPYSFDWTTAAVGDFVLTAKAIDNAAGATTSAPVTLHVLANTAPSVALTSPADGASADAIATIELVADASDTDGSISKVEFFNGATLLATDTDAPYEFSWTGVLVGDYTLTAKATDNLNLAATSASVLAHVVSPAGNAAPGISLDAPADGTTFVTPATVNLTATASDDGSITRVEFFDGATKLGEDTSDPYAFAWIGAPLGDHSITARATDNFGVSTTTSAITIHVVPNQAPLVTVNNPADDAAGIGTSTSLDLTLSDPEAGAMTVMFYGRKAGPAAPGSDFSLIAIPDTQDYSENTGSHVGAVIATFNAQTQWIVDNRDTRNIAFVSHMGDIVQNGESISGVTNTGEWTRADGAMMTIEDQLSTLRAFGIPWGGATGNHDIGAGGAGSGATTLYNTYFGFNRWAGRPYFGGHYSATNENNFQFFSASGLDFIIVHIGYRSSADQAVMDWADALLKANPDRRAIITSHEIVGTGNPASFQGQGSAIYTNLRDNPNLFLLLCGHVNGEGRRFDTFSINSVNHRIDTILSDYQEITGGGNGFLRVLTFSPANSRIHVESWSPTLGRAVQASDSVPQWTTAFDLTYDMQSAVTDWIPLGTVDVPPAGTSASLLWSGLETDSRYEWFASVTDGINTTSTATRRFTTAVSVAPTVALTSPAPGTSFPQPATVHLAADADDADGSVARVEFYAEGVKLGQDTSAPFEFDWTGVSPGDYALTAVAFDNTGHFTLSSVVNVTVINQPPVVALTEPEPDLNTYDALASVFMSADASDPDGAVAKVEFYANTTKVGEDTTAPYEFTWTNVISGSYALTAKAIDDGGAVTTSAPVGITVGNVDNIAPSVAITAPTAGVVFAGNITITASASDADGTVVKVEFFEGATKLGEDTTAPFSFLWPGVAVGNYTLSAVAADNDGGTTTSTVVGISVQTAPLSFAQNFDSMGTAGTAPPSGWSIKNGNSGSANTTWTDSIPIIANGANSVAAMVNAAGALTVNNAPTATNNNGYNAQGASSSDRVIATSPTSVSGGAIQWQVTNTGTTAITAVRIGYDIRRYTVAGTANELPGYWLFYSLDNGTTWTNVATLNPTLGGAGIQVPNTVGVTTVPPTDFTLSSSWAAGATLLLRWVDDNAVATSPDQIVGLDNVTLTAAAAQIGAAPTVAISVPTSGSVFAVGDTINLTATANDTDGTVTKVEFYDGATKFGEATAEPFQFPWTGFAAGAHNLTARATDNDGNIVISSAVSITVNATPGSGTLLRGPYLNMANDTSIVVRWRSSQPVIGRVRYGLSTATLTSFTDETAAKTDHEVRLTGLTPYTRYYYSVGSALDALTPETVDTTTFRPAIVPAVPSASDYTFRSSPVPGTATDTRVWIVGDCGRGSTSQAGGRDAYYNWMGGRIPDLNLQLGDNAYNAGTDAEYQTGYFLMYPSLFRKMPQWSTLGNHDANNGDTDPTKNWPYFDMFTFPKAGEAGGVSSGTEHYYSFDYGNIHFISMDSQTSLANSSPTAPQTLWLQADLASTTATWIIVFFHHPPYSKGSHNSDTESQMVTMRQIYNPIFEAGGVDLVLTGHSHNYERSVLLDGHYGISTTITPAMKLDAGNGSTTGFTTGANGVIRNAATGFNAVATINGAVIPPDGAYHKPLTGPRDHFGAIYNTAGMSGQADGGSLNHTAMYISYNSVGTVNLDINDNTLVATFVQAGGTAPDNYTIIKSGAADSDDDGISDEYEIANGLDRHNPLDADLDLDGDQSSNRLEYALNTAANVPNRAGLPTLGTGSGADAGKLTLTFNRARSELTYTVQASDDLKTFVDIATNPGAVGNLVTVVDNNTTSPNRYLRLRVTDGVVATTTVPVGRMTYTLAQNQETAVSFPLSRVIGSIGGRPAGFITAVGAATIDYANAGWTPGELSQIAAPYFLRITSGAAKGRFFQVSTSPATPNTATQLTLNTGGVDLNTLGIVAGADTYELYPGETLASLFPTGTLLSGTASTGDTLRLWNGSAWLTYFHNGSQWMRQGGSTSDNIVVRPDQGWMLLRRGSNTDLVGLGQVSSTDGKVAIARGAQSFVSLLPVSRTFAEFQLQNNLAGWASNPAAPTSGDYVRIWNGSAWLNYYYDGAKWMRQGGADSSNVVLLKPGRPVFIVRPTGTGSDTLTQTKTY